MSLQYVYTIATPELFSFTMPQGFQSNVQVYLWGAGGGQGSGGGAGAGGGFVQSNIAVNQGDFVQVDVGGAGQDAASAYSGGAGGTSNLPSQFAGGNGGSGYDSDGDGDGPWAGGGGGAATAVLVNGVPIAVAAGGGGGGGLFDDGGAGYGGLPGGVQAQPSGWYPVSNGAWCNFLNTYGIWTGGSNDVTTNTYQTTVNFPTTSGYTFYLSTDNYGTLSVDSNVIVTSSSYTSVASATTYISAGTHTVTLSITNTGGPAGIGAQILNPDTSELWDSRLPVNFPALNSNSLGGGGALAGGGGGGGYRGGLGGAANYGGSGGLQLGQVTVPGNGIHSGGIGQLYAPPENAGWAGYPGYAVLVFTRKFSGYIKESGAWKQLLEGYVKVPTSTSLVTPPPTVNTVTFNTVGATGWTVPNNVTSIAVSIAGAGGGTSGMSNGSDVWVLPNQSGSAGDLVTGTLSVTPGEILFMVVGQGGITGTDSWVYRAGQQGTAGNGGSGVNAGGAGDNYGGQGAYPAGGGGGGSSGILLGSTVLVAAAGGAGGGYAGGGGTGGTGYVPAGFVDTSGAGSAGGQGANTQDHLINGNNGLITITYSTPNAPIEVVSQSGWKSIEQAWIKNNGTWTPILSNSQILPAQVFTDQVTHTITIPSGVSLINVYLAGGGGGGGGNDSHIGYPGFAGSIITGNLSVSPGDVITVSVGSGGGGGGSGQGTGISTPGQYSAIGGISTLGYVGGRGGYPGTSGWSGEGGGGGAATVIQKNGTTVAIAGGGGGGGGGGNYSNGLGQGTPSYTGQIYGGQGIDHSGDGGGSGGGGGGNVGGAGGATVGGDNGSYSGSNGTNLLPAGWVQTSANNGGSLYVAGGSGIAIISF